MSTQFRFNFSTGKHFVILHRFNDNWIDNHYNDSKIEANPFAFNSVIIESSELQRSANEFKKMYSRRESSFRKTSKSNKRCVINAVLNQ